MAAPRRRTSAEFQGNGSSLMPPSAHAIASPRGGGSSAPSREDHAVTANGAPRGAKPRGGGSVSKVSSRRRPAGGMRLWRVGIFVSVALNVATLALLLHHYAVSHPHHPPGVASPDQHHHACAPQPDTSGAAARAPSTGKPAVTPDSVINLDHTRRFLGALPGGACPCAMSMSRRNERRPRGHRRPDSPAVHAPVAMILLSLSPLAGPFPPSIDASTT